MASNLWSRRRWLEAALALTACLIVPLSTAFAQDADATVDMRGLFFAPFEIHIAPGQSVLWTNSSAVGHSVTADDGSFDSGNVDPGDTFTQSFEEPGVYQYYCEPHGSAGLIGMAGKVVVDDPDAAIAGLMAHKSRDPNPTEHEPGY
jgi:plastocyanin